MADTEADQATGEIGSFGLHLSPGNARSRAATSGRNTIARAAKEVATRMGQSVMGREARLF